MIVLDIFIDQRFFFFFFVGGSVMAAFIAGMGYLTIMWGQMNEDRGVGTAKDDKNISSDDLSSAKVPLLDDEESQV